MSEIGYMTKHIYDDEEFFWKRLPEPPLGALKENGDL